MILDKPVIYPRSPRWSSLIALIACFLVAAPTRAETRTVPAFPFPETQNGEAALTDTIPSQPHPDSIPYDARPVFARQLLKLPAYLFHTAVLPLKWSVIWVAENQVDQKLLNFFLNDDRTAGFYPNISVGGRTPFAAGVTYFNRNAFSRNHSVDLNLFYSGNTNFKAGLNYLIPPEQHRRFQFNIKGNIRSDDDENFFLEPGDELELTRASYEIDEYSVQTELGYLIRPNLFGMITGGIRHTDIYGATPATNQPDIIPLSDQTPGYGLTTLLNAGLAFTFDFRNSLLENRNTNLVSRVTTTWNFKQTKIRTYSGALFDAGIRYNHSLNSNRYEFLHYYGEWQQYLPIPGLPLTRRLAFRTRLEKRDPLGNSEIPFLEQSILGDADNLRGYAQDRFRNLGSLLLTLEYRYPIWDTWDAVIFTDQGQVFNKYSELALDNFRGSVGTGLRFMTSSDFLFRVEVAFSKETTRGLLEFTMNF